MPVATSWSTASGPLTSGRAASSAREPSDSRDEDADGDRILHRVGYTVLVAADALWRPSNQMGVLNTNLAQQLSATMLGARLWRLMPGQTSTRHRHFSQHELYVVLDGTGRIRVDDELLTLPRLSSALVDPESIRQVFNDTAAEVLWLIVGTPPEPANTLEMTPEQLAHIYPDGPKARPPELADR